MKKVVFYKVLLLAVFAVCIIYISCNTIDKDEPVYNERNNTVTEKDREAIISSYTQGVHAVSFLDSAKLYAGNAGIKKTIFGLSDFYSDLNGHLKSLAIEKNISLAQAANIEKGNANSKTIFDKGFIDEAIEITRQEITLFNEYATGSTDGDTKNYFIAALPGLKRQLDILTNLSANIK